MSRWLQSVNNLLEKLDETVEGAVQKSEYDANDIALNGFYSEEIVGVSGQSSVDDILAKRGLLDDDDLDLESAEEFKKKDKHSSDETTTKINEWNKSSDKVIIDQSDSSVISKESTQKEKLNVANVLQISSSSDNSGFEPVSSTNTNDYPKGGKDDASPEERQTFDLNRESNEENKVNKNSTLKNVNADESNNNSMEERKEVKAEESEENTHLQRNSSFSLQTSRNDDETAGNSDAISEDSSSYKNIIVSETNNSDEIMEEQKKSLLNAQEEAKQASLEVRKLRRHIIKINSQLENAEREMEAQRVELDRAALRMEKDRLRHKEEKERISKGYKEDMKNIAEEHKLAIKSMLDAHEEQLVDRDEWITRTEEARVKEGGDMNKELEEAAKRELDLLAKITSLEDEKRKLLQQTSSNETLMTSLQSRLETVTKAEEIATAREKEADDRLDAAISLHARQLSQRQARETELERAVADLGAALVLSRRNEKNNLELTEIQSRKGLSSSHENDRKKLTFLEDELDNVKNSLLMERQRCESLQCELEDTSKERSTETFAFQAKQKQHEIQVANLRSTIKALQLNLRDLKNLETSKNNDASSKHNVEGRQNREKDFELQISKLSKELFHERRKFENSASEVSTLRKRLGTALKRATKAEDALQKVPLNNDDLLIGQMGNRRAFGRMNDKYVVPSIRSAIKCDPGRGETKETIGIFVDAIDQWAVDLGAFLRINPIARLGFLIYCFFLHLWAFFILFHISALVSSKFDNNITNDVHGPHSILKHSYRHMEQVKGHNFDHYYRMVLSLDLDQDFHKIQAMDSNKNKMPLMLPMLQVTLLLPNV